MSRTADSRSGGDSGSSTSGLEGLRQSPEFSGRVEPDESHDHANEHFALIYESEEELFTGIAPFLRQGLERGEQCIVVIDERSEEAMAGALRSRGIAVEEATDAGALQFVSVQETYLRSDSFDPGEMIAFYRDHLETVLEEYAGFRVVAGTSWIDEVSFDAFLEYEGRVNAVFEDRDAMAMCHYDRRERSPEVIREIIKTHPYLISEGTVCHNFYYTPPEELLGVEEAAHEVDRMLGTVRDRARAKTDLAEHTAFLQDLYEITADPDRSFDAKLQALFDLGCDQFDLEVGGLNKVDPERDRFEVEYISQDHELFEPGAELPLSETYCQAAADMKAVASVTEPPSEGFDETLIYEEYGTRAYLGTHIPVDGDVDRTLGFIAEEPPTEAFTERDRTSVELMGQWVKYELDRQQYRSELEGTVDQLQQSNDRLKQFAYAASHDLQEPLRMVSTYVQLLEDRYGEELDADAQEYIGFAVDGAERMREMVEDLLAYSRVEQTDGLFEPVDCEALVDAVTHDLQVRIEETDADVTVGPLPTVVADGEQLEELFQNLVSNAIKYSGEAPPSVEIAAQERNASWVFSVADDGIGMDPAKTDRIFEVFKRLHHEEEYPGTGIGLSLCQEIVENHGGEIWVDSTPGEGSTFYFTLGQDPWNTEPVAHHG